MFLLLLLLLLLQPGLFLLFLLFLLMLLLLVVLSGVHCSPDPRQVPGNVYLQPLGMKLVAVGVLMLSAFSASCMSIVIISSC